MMNVRRSGSFNLSPRKSFATPSTVVTSSSRRQSFNTSSNSLILFDGSGNDDEAEKRERQLNRLQQLQSRGVHSPSATPGDRRKSINSFSGLTNQQLTEHYAKCIQLSAENKINIKNAFNLQLIDYMTELLKRQNSEMNNFQVASCTLDASTKIYSYRVDSVHTDTLKMAGGLGRTKDKPDGNQHDAQGDDEYENRAKGKKRKSKKCATIESNLKNLDVAHFDLAFDVDPLFKKTAAQFDEGTVGGGQFLNTLQFLDERSQLVLDSDAILKDLEKEKQNEKEVTFLIPVPDINSKVICSTFSSFEFTTWKLSNEDSLRDTRVPLNDLENDNAFDINAVPEPLDEPEQEPFEADDVNIPGDENEMEDENTVITIGGGIACKQVDRPPPPQLEVIHLKHYLSENPLEYSYFDSRVMSAWAGPGHWKLKPLIKGRDVDKEGNKLKEKHKKEFSLDFFEDVDIVKPFATSRAATKLSQSTVKKWSIVTTTTPIDLHYDPSNFFKLYLRSSISVRKREIKLEDEIKNESAEEMEYKVNNNTMLDAEEASNYGDNSAPGYDDTDLFSQTVYPTQPDQDQNKDFFGDNLVQAPNKVSLVNIGYARTAKKMDMKKLKSAMWILLSEPDSDKENDRNHQHKDRINVKESKKFSTLYSDLHPRLPPKMTENLSVPLAFIALLHLANEQTLKLASVAEIGDFIISQD